MPKKKTENPAQIALQVTWRLKGELKRRQQQYLRIGALIARVRDEKLWRALQHDSIESWAEQRIGLRRAALYRNLQVYDWVKERHPEWLRPKAKGFIPELTDVVILRAIEKQLDGNLSPERRKVFESLRREALAGELTQKEYARAVGPGAKRKAPLRAFADRLRALQASAAKLRGLPADVAAELGAIHARVDELLRAQGELARLAPGVNAELARLELRQFTTAVV